MGDEPSTSGAGLDGKCVMGVSTSEVREAFENLSKEEWDELNRRLTRFYYRYYRRERRLERDDLINKAILDVLEGRRNWPAGVKLATLLCGAMRSNASHILKSMNGRPTQPIEETSELALLKKEDFSAYLQLCDELRDRVPNNDLLLAGMVDLLIQDPKLKRSDFLGLLRDVPKKDVYNAHRRLNRLIDKLHEE